MSSRLRKVLGFLASGAAMLVLYRGARRHGCRGNGVRSLIDRVRPPPVADVTVAARVRKKLQRTASDPTAITVAIEHGCVDLRGPVETRERALIVRAVATIPGVDSVLDLMTEPRVAALPSPS